MSNFKKFKLLGNKRILLTIPLLMAFVIFNSHKGKETSGFAESAGRLTKAKSVTDSCDLSNALTTFQYLDGITEIRGGLVVTTDEVPGALYYMWYHDSTLLEITYGPTLSSVALCGYHDLDVRAVTPCGVTNQIGGPYTGITPYCNE